MTDLFTPIQLGELLLSNRIVMAPMTRNRAGEKGIPNELNAQYYAQRASAGLIITEGTYPHPTSRAYDRETAIARLESGDADLVAFGRAFLANPDLPQRLRKQTSLNEVDYSTFYTPGAKGYTDYPTLDERQAA